MDTQASRFLDICSSEPYRSGMSTKLASDRDLVTVRVALKPDDPVERLRALKVADETVEGWLADAVDEARRAGRSWSAIGEALGVSRQAAWQLYNTGLLQAIGNAREKSGMTEQEAEALASDELRAVRSRHRP